MHTLLEFLHGKKATIVAIITTTTAFLSLKSMLDLEMMLEREFSMKTLLELIKM